jgi:hypothetical protein
MSKHITFLEWMLRTTKLRLEFGMMIKENVDPEIVVSKDGWDELSIRFARLRESGNNVEACWAGVAPTMGGWVSAPGAGGTFVTCGEDNSERTGPQKMIYTPGSSASFRCHCRSNVFTQIRTDLYRCNGCRTMFKGEPVRTATFQPMENEPIIESPLWQRLGWSCDVCPACGRDGDKLTKIPDAQWLCECGTLHAEKDHV